MARRNKDSKPVLFVFSVDTEEEWDWSGPFPQQDFSVNNISKLTGFQQMCDKIGIKPTYFVDYAVAENTTSAEVLKSLVADNNCEIGAHLHPWCNPPYFGYTGEKESHLVNLPIEQVEQKLITLIELLTKQFGYAPHSFRSGRWGINGEVMQLLVKHGFKVDSSVHPFYDEKYYTCQGAPALPYKPNLLDPRKIDNSSKMDELPVTAGFNHSNFLLCEKLYNFISRESIDWLRLVGVAWHTRILRKCHMSPEGSDVNEMLTLSRIVIKKGYPILHMYIHSSCLIDNNNSLVGNQNAYSHICNAVEEVVTQIQEHTDLHFCTISEAAEILNDRGQI